MLFLQFYTHVLHTKPRTGNYHIYRQSIANQLFFAKTFTRKDFTDILRCVRFEKKMKEVNDQRLTILQKTHIFGIHSSKLASITTYQDRTLQLTSNYFQQKRPLNTCQTNPISLE